MDAKKIGNYLIVRIDKDEDLLGELEKACKAHDVKLAIVTGIGAADRAVVGAYSVATKEYKKHTFENMEMEITTLMGSITTMDGEFYPHIHANIALPDGTVIGGHANELRISATAEIFVEIIDGEVDRFHDDSVGLNILDFE